jgi:hypothetical protein
LRIRQSYHAPTAGFNDGSTIISAAHMSPKCHRTKSADAATRSKNTGDSIRVPNMIAVVKAEPG